VAVGSQGVGGSKLGIGVANEPVWTGKMASTDILLLICIIIFLLSHLVI